MPAVKTENLERLATLDLGGVSRATSRSPVSDEGIEPDADRRLIIARCWSVDSAVPGDEDFSSGMRNKSRVTRCCSSDSAVISDEEQNKGLFKVSSGPENGILGPSAGILRDKGLKARFLQRKHHLYFQI